MTKKGLSNFQKTFDRFEIYYRSGEIDFYQFLSALRFVDQMGLIDTPTYMNSLDRVLELSRNM